MRALRTALSLIMLLTALILPGWAAETYRGEGTVNTVVAQKKTVNITHGPIQGLGWPGMTMDFAVRDQAVLTGIKAGQKVAFDLAKDKNGQYVITAIRPAN